MHVEQVIGYLRLNSLICAKGGFAERGLALSRGSKKLKALERGFVSTVERISLSQFEFWLM